MGSPTLTARYIPRSLLPGLVATLALAAAGVVTALAGVAMGWILTAFMLWSVANTVRKLTRTDPVLTLDATGITDHRVPRTVRWDEVASMRTVDRRVVFVKVPLLELVPQGPVERDGRTMIGAVVRGDIAFADARDDKRVMADLKHLDRTPEEILGVARALRTS